MITFISYLTGEHSLEFFNKNFRAILHQIPLETSLEFRRDYEYLESKKLEIIEAFFTSVALFHPNSRRILIVDQQVDVKKLRGPFETRKEKRNTPFFPLEKFAAWRHFLLDSNKEEGPVLFMDWDIIVQERLDSIFLGEQDFFICYTDKKEIGPNHFNVGVMGVGANSKKKVAHFFHLLLFMIQSNKAASMIDWWGDQAAVEAVFAPYWEQILSKQEAYLPRENLHVKFLDEAIYNRPMYDYLNTLIEAKILHFRGNAKKKLLLYWHNHKVALQELAGKIDYTGTC